MNRWTKCLAVLLAVLMVVALFAACSDGGGGDSKEPPTDGSPEPTNEGDSDPGEEGVEQSHLTMSDDKVTLTHWTGFSGPDRDVLEGIFDKFNKTDPEAQVSLTAMTWQILDQKLATAYASESGPDFFCGSAGRLSAAVDAGAILDITGAFDDGRLDRSLYPQGVMESMTVDGKIVCTPQDAFGYVMYYNVDLLAADGFTAPPATEEEMWDMAKKLVKYDDGGNPIQFGFCYEYASLFGNFYWNQGLDIMDMDTMTSTINAPGAAEYLTKIQNLYMEDNIAPARADITNLFNASKLAMYIGGPWNTVSHTEAGINFDLAKAPTGDNVLGVAHYFIPLSYIGEKLDNFIDFASFWMERENQVTWCKGSGYPPFRPDMIGCEELEGTWSGKIGELAPDYTVKAYLKVPGFATIDADILPNLYDGVTMGAFPDMQAALDEVAAQIDELIKDAGY